MFLKKVTLASAFAITAGTAYAGCEISGNVSIVGNEFPAIHTVANGAAACTGGDVKINLTADHQKINVDGMSGNPAEYTSAIIANSSVVALMNADVVRPLNDLVAAHGQDIPKNQLITIDGNVMAVAFMANAQTLAYRKDVLAEIGVDVPTTYEEVLEAAKKIRAAGISKYPWAAPMRRVGTWPRNSPTCTSVMAANSISPVQPKFQLTMLKVLQL